MRQGNPMNVNMSMSSGQPPMRFSHPQTNAHLAASMKRAGGLPPAPSFIGQPGGLPRHPTARNRKRKHLDRSIMNEV